MPRVHPRQTCKVCGAHRDDVGDMSARGKCLGCGERRVREAATQLTEHAGPWFDYWRSRSAAALGAVIPERTA